MMITMERVATQSLLGIRFWDPVIGQPVAQGLRVTAQLLKDEDPPQRVGRVIPGVLTSNGIYAFFGLRSGELPPADQTLWDTLPAARFVLIEVVDPTERYLPLAFVARTPWRGPFRGEGEWLEHPLHLPPLPPTTAPGVYLWSGPRRTIPAGLAMIQGQLVVGTAPNPSAASFAIVQVRNEEGQLFAVGMTDQMGKLTLPLPYPAIPTPLNGDPFPPLHRQRFAIAVTVHYTLDAQKPLAQGTMPNLALLLAQPAAQIAVQYDPNAAPGSEPYTLGGTLPLQMTFGAPLVLRTPIAGNVRGEPYLRIQPT